MVTGEVDYISDITYKIERKKMEIPITHTDGSGMILPALSKKNFMVRLPWIKGLLASFDYVKFIKMYNCSPIVTDIYGKRWNISIISHGMNIKHFLSSSIVKPEFVTWKKIIFQEQL
jgi:hypothetical protein